MLFELNTKNTKGRIVGLKRENILDDIARVAGGTVNVVSGVKNQVKDEVKSRIDDAIHRMDLVPREDFERLEMTLNAAIKRIDALEGKKAPAQKTAKKTTAKKSVAKKKAAAKKTTTNTASKAKKTKPIKKK